MNIGFLVNFKWYPLQGGGTVHVYQVARHLVQQGHRLHSIFYYDPAPDVRVYRQRQLMQFLKNIDILYIRVDGKFGLEKWTSLKMLKPFLRVVWEINSPVEEMLSRGKSPLQVKLWSFMRRVVAIGVDAAICVSQEMKAYAENQLGISRAYYVPNGSDPELFLPQKRNQSIYPSWENHFKLVWAGSSHYSWQGWDFILQVARKIEQVDHLIKFILITKARDIKVKAGMPKNVEILDEKDYLELPPYLASADAGLCLYNQQNLNGQFYFSPLKLFDYMACSLPVIATDVGQIKDVIKDGENGILVNNDIDTIIAKILFLKNNPQEAQRLGSSARKSVVDYYNWGRVGEETEEILQGSVKKKLDSHDEN